MGSSSARPKDSLHSPGFDSPFVLAILEKNRYFFCFSMNLRCRFVGQFWRRPRLLFNNELVTHTITTCFYGKGPKIQQCFHCRQEKRDDARLDSTATPPTSPKTPTTAKSTSTTFWLEQIVEDEEDADSAVDVSAAAAAGSVAGGVSDVEADADSVLIRAVDATFSWHLDASDGADAFRLDGISVEVSIFFVHLIHRWHPSTKVWLAVLGLHRINQNQCMPSLT